MANKESLILWMSLFSSGKKKTTKGKRVPRPPPLPRIEDPGQKKANSAQEMPRPFAPDKEVNGNASPQTTTAVSPGAAKTKEPDMRLDTKIEGE
jgi:hypothetical protein